MKPRLVHELLESAAERYGDRSAVVDRGGCSTYAELEHAANRLAHLLIDNGVRPGDRIGIFLDKSLQAVVGAYAVMKAGATYVPFDPQAPEARLAFIARDAGVTLLITGAEKAGAWPTLLAEGAPLEVLVAVNAVADEVENASGGARLLAAEDAASYPTEPVRVRREPTDLAYILYTSGSTGEPKGVMLSHLNAMSFIEWSADEFAVSKDDRLSSHAPLHFDLSVFDLFGAAKGGAAVVLVPPATSVFPVELARFIQDEGITVWYSVPSILSMLVLRGNLSAVDLSRLRAVLFAGEVFPTKYLVELMKLVPWARFSNLFGPTETNVCTWYDVPREPLDITQTIPIGKPIRGVTAHITDEEGNAVLRGEVGELWIEGPTVMQGYWADPERTAKALERRNNSSGNAYRTGDLVRKRDDGQLLFIGRRDSQIKSRGYRIELGDIEATLAAHANVTECAAVPIPDPVVTNRIKAYVAASNGTPAAELVRFCKERLPRYMIPDLIEVRDTLPKSSTGKIDRKKLINEAVAEST